MARRRSKILATLGPATDRPGVLDALVAAGIDGARINCSHGTPDEWRARAVAVRAAAAAAGRPIALVMDLSGPKIRLAPSVAPREAAVGDEMMLVAVGADGGAPPDALRVEYPDFADLISEGRSEIVLGDGTPRLAVTRVEGEGADRVVVARCERPGAIGPRKGVNVTFSRAHAPALTEKDLADLDVVVEVGADLVALSFVRSDRDIVQLRRELGKRGSHARVIAKIEKVEAMVGLDAIIEEADGVMVARGDLGVEAGVARVPLLQKEIIHRATVAGRLVITATQMLESMIGSPEPTRAEATDVANAIIDGTSALMLSAETATGRYPVEAVAAMAEIALEAEEAEPFRAPNDLQEAQEAAVMQAAVFLARAIEARALVVPTTTGGSARACAKHRPRQVIVALALTETVANQLALEWGVVPAVVEPAAGMSSFVEGVLLRAQQVGRLSAGSRVVLTYGPVVAEAGGTSVIVVQRIGRPASWRGAIHRSPGRPARRPRPGG